MSTKFSIVIPVYNKVHFTKQCLEDLSAQQLEDTEIIVIDNASSDETPDYLNSLSGIRYIQNQNNLGCSKAWNQGVRASGGDWIVVLNNDVRLPEGWLQRMHDFAVGGEYDVVSPGMREGELNYKLADYAEEYCSVMRKVYRNWTPTGVCFMVAKKVFEEVGLFDEKFEIGQYEDADFFRRCKRHGCKMGLTGNAFIHHFGSVTQNDIKKKNVTPDYAKRNQAYYRKKWKLGWFRRHFERYREQFLVSRWSQKEFSKYKHSILEKFDGSELTYH